MTHCAQKDFEAASNGYGQRYSELSKPLPSAQRDRLRRMARERTVNLQALSTCREGDVTGLDAHHPLPLKGGP